ncbi:MAG: hypothetical protein HQL15_06390 [Candidatus Omnitrophica bacterium]|nr:hypothetical protein [Candidatus Omnitrophota bacterium]
MTRSKGVLIAGSLLMGVGALEAVGLFNPLFRTILFSFPSPPGIAVLWPFIVIFIGIGLLMLKEWVRKTLIIYLVLNIVVVMFFCFAFASAGSHIRNPQPLTEGVALGVIYKKMTRSIYLVVTYILPSAIYLYFLTRPKVKSQFK